MRALTFNPNFQEIAALSLNGYIHIWSAENFRQKLSRKLPSSQENVCLAVQETSGLYAIGCKSYTLLLDCRTLQVLKEFVSSFVEFLFSSSRLSGFRRVTQVLEFVRPVFRVMF